MSQPINPVNLVGTLQSTPTAKSSLNTTSLFGRIQKAVTESTFGQKVLPATAALMATPIGAIIAGTSALVAVLAAGLLNSANKTAQAQALEPLKTPPTAPQPTFSQQVLQKGQDMLQKGQDTVKAGLNYVRQNPVKTALGVATAAATVHVGFTYAKNLSIVNKFLLDFSLKERLVKAASLTTNDLTEQALNSATFTLDHASRTKEKIGNFVSAASKLSQAKTAVNPLVTAPNEAFDNVASFFSRPAAALGGVRYLFMGL